METYHELLTHNQRGHGVDEEALCIRISPPAGHREGSPDEISRKRKLAAEEKCFRGRPDFF